MVVCRHLRYRRHALSTRWDLNCQLVACQACWTCSCCWTSTTPAIKSLRDCLCLPGTRQWFQPSQRGLRNSSSAGLQGRRCAREVNPGQQGLRCLLLLAGGAACNLLPLHIYRHISDSQLTYALTIRVYSCLELASTAELPMLPGPSLLHSTQ